VFLHMGVLECSAQMTVLCLEGSLHWGSFNQKHLFLDFLQEPVASLGVKDLEV
jgi:hypothetical protein